MLEARVCHSCAQEAASVQQGLQATGDPERGSSLSQDLGTTTDLEVGALGSHSPLLETQPDPLLLPRPSTSQERVLGVGLGSPFTRVCPALA